MELELRARLSERPVPPGCGQRGHVAQPCAAASLCFPGQKGKGPDQPESLSPTHAPSWYSDTPVHLHSDSVGTGHLHVHPSRGWVSLICLPNVQPKARDRDSNVAG